MVMMVLVVVAADGDYDNCGRFNRKDDGYGGFDCYTENEE